jgi:hypothetical protein
LCGQGCRAKGGKKTEGSVKLAAARFPVERPGGVSCGRRGRVHGSQFLYALCRAARADLARSVSDDPHRTLAEGAIEVPLFWPKPKADSFCGTRHNSLIRSIFLSVVKSFPAIRSITSLPRAASRRRLEALTEPSGYANAAATLSRSGVSAVRSLRFGRGFPSIHTSRPRPARLSGKPLVLTAYTSCGGPNRQRGTKADNYRPASFCEPVHAAWLSAFSI